LIWKNYWCLLCGNIRKNSFLKFFCWSKFNIFSNAFFRCCGDAEANPRLSGCILYI
jgi:hypothetical protein